jgi:hypothetical protein
MNIQPKLGTKKLHKTASKTAARLFVKRIPHATNTAERIAATQNTVRSIPGLSDLCSTGLLPSLPLESLYLKHTLYLIPSWEAVATVPDRAACLKLAPALPPAVATLTDSAQMFVLMLLSGSRPIISPNVGTKEMMECTRDR